MPSREMSWVSRASSERPSNSTSPWTSGTRRMIAFIRVLLPAPLPPTSVTSSPGPTSSETLSSATTFPYDTVTLRMESKLIAVPQIGGYYRRIALDLLRRSGRDDGSRAEHGDLVGNAHHQA